MQHILSSVEAYFQSMSFWHGIASAVGVGLALKLAKQALRFFQDRWRRMHHFGITGFWIGSCWLPSYGDSKYLEIWRYSGKGDSIAITFFAYDPRDGKIYEWKGHGVFRGSKFSAYYYRLDRNTYESGVIALGLAGLNLRGVYAQFDPKLGNEPFHASSSDYEQYRIRLPFRARVRMAMGFPPLKTFEEVRLLHEAAARQSLVPARDLMKPPVKPA